MHPDKFVHRTQVVMGIRKSAREVFEAFVDPKITSQFWFTKGSARLELGKQAKWDWEMYGVSDTVTVKVLEPNRKLVVESSDTSLMEWTFEAVGPDATFVTVSHSGFDAEGDTLLQQMLADVEGWTLVLAGAKAWLEHGIRLNLVLDHAAQNLKRAP